MNTCIVVFVETNLFAPVQTTKNVMHYNELPTLSPSFLILKNIVLFC